MAKGRTNNVKPGTNTSDATAGVNDVRSGKTAYNATGKITGNLVELDTSDATAVASDVRAGKSAYVNGIKISGNLADNGAIGNITPGVNDITIPAGITTGGLIFGDADLLAANIKPGISIFGVSGTFTNDSNATAADIKAGVTAYVAGLKITGTMAAKGAQTYTPGTSDQTIAANQWLSGVQTISGDPDLVAGNIKSGVNIFNVTGTYSPGGSWSSPTYYGDNYDSAILNLNYSGPGVAYVTQNIGANAAKQLFFSTSLVTNGSGYITSIDGITFTTSAPVILRGYSRVNTLLKYQAGDMGASTAGAIANLNYSGRGIAYLFHNPGTGTGPAIFFSSSIVTDSSGRVTSIDGVTIGTSQPKYLLGYGIYQ